MKLAKLTTAGIIPMLFLSYCALSQEINEIDSCKIFGNSSVQEIFPIENACDVPLQDRPVVAINEIILSDIVLISELNRIDLEVSHQDSLFSSGMGVLEVYTYQSYESDLLRRYYITPQYIDINKYSSDESYPLYFAVLNKRMIIIHPNPLSEIMCYRFSKKSKKKFREKLEYSLPKTEKAVFYNLDGTEAFVDKNFRMTPTYLHTGTIVSIYSDRVESIREREFYSKE